MAMQASDPNMQSSSIALLQGRFRQMQRAKEIREERELFKLLSETVRKNTSMYYYEPFFQADSCRQAPHETILKLQPYLVFLQKDIEIKEKADRSNNLWSKDTEMHRRILNDDEHSDIDTSLHL